MTTVSFSNRVYYDFAEAFLQGATACSFDVQFHPQNMKIQVNHTVLTRLLERMSNGQSVILPYCGSKIDHWIITDITRRRLDQTLARVSNFVIPSYAEFGTPSQVPQLKLFDPDKNQLQKLGAALYQTGYYSWQSPPHYRTIIFNRLALWLDLEEKQPTLRAQQTISYHTLHQTFEMALAAGNWLEADTCLHEMQRLNLSTADNLMFLRIQLLAQQQQWQVIWKHPNFSVLAKMRLPRAVRAALLTAFHHTELLPSEQKDDWQTALSRFRAAKPKLGTLLTGRFGVTQGPVVRVFAYLSILAKDRDNLAKLMSVESDLETQHCLENLAKLLPSAPQPILLEIDPLTQARLALFNADYDLAIQAAGHIEDSVDRTLLLLELAFHSNDLNVVDKASTAYVELLPEQQANLHQRHPQVERYLEFVTATTTPDVSIEVGPSTVTTPVIENWLEWFEQMEAAPDAPYLASTLEYLKTVTDDRFWTPENVSQVNQRLLGCITQPALLSRSVTRDALHYLTTFFLKDAGFPREEEAYIELYEVLLWGLQEQGQVNETNSLAFLRLAEGVLRQSPFRRDEILKNFQTWFAKPIPALENQVVEAFELLAEYGLEGWHLVDWYRTWVTQLLNLPTSRDRVSLEGWHAFGAWIQPGDDLLHHLKQSLTTVIEQDIDNPVERLPAGYRIGIFTLRASSAERSKQLLLQRNPALDIRICLEKDLTATAKSMAQNSEMVVVVTTCITHALTYGIQPYLASDPVYPISSGSTSIVRAIEEYLVKHS